MTQIFTGRDFVVMTELAPKEEGTCPLFDSSGVHLGDVKGLIRVNCLLDDDWPESFVDQGNGSYFRISLDGLGYGTSVVGSPSFRTYATMHFIPTPRRIEIGGDPDRFQIFSEGTFHERNMEVATVESKRVWHRPEKGRGSVHVDISTTLRIHKNVPLTTTTEYVEKDRFRWYMLSSMYVNDITYDSNLLRFEDAEGHTQEISISEAYRVNRSNRRDGHLFPRPLALGGWVEMIKTTGSTWLPKSPSIRYEIQDAHDMKLGLQGWWSGSDNPDDDNLNIWLEWIDAPTPLLPGMSPTLDVRVISLPCMERTIPVSRPIWPIRLWKKPTDYSNRMNYDYANK